MTAGLVTFDVAADATHSVPNDLQWTTVDVATLPGTANGDADHDTLAWVLPGLLERQSRLLIAGDEGAGKSLLLMQWAVQLAAGLTCVPGAGAPAGPLRVLIVDTELNERTARRRLRPMADHANLQPGQLLYVLAPAGIDVLRDNERDALLAIARRFRPHVIGLDSLYRAFNGDPDDPRVGGQVQRVLDTARASTGAALIVACHYRKRSTDGRTRRTLDDLAGSRVWKAWPETAIDVTRDRLRVLKDREGLATELTLERRDAGEWETDIDGWPMTIGDTDPAATGPTWRGHTLIQPYVLAVLARADQPISTSRVRDLVAEERATENQKPFHRSNVAAALGELQDLGQVARQPGARGANDWRITTPGIHRISHNQAAPETPHQETPQ